MFRALNDMTYQSILKYLTKQCIWYRIQQQNIKYSANVPAAITNKTYIKPIADKMTAKTAIGTVSAIFNDIEQQPKYSTS